MHGNAELTPLESYAQAVRLRDEGMNLAAMASNDWLGRARAIAKHLAATDGETNIEIVYGKVGLPPNPNAAGSVFRGKEWHCVGILPAMRSSRHAGTIRRWVLA